MLTSAVLLATSLVTLSAAPAHADAYAAPLLLNFDSTATGPQNGMHYSGNGDGWFEVIADSNQPWAPANGSIGSTNMAKGVMGGGGYSGVFVAQAVSATSSLVSSTTAIVTMNFWAPEAGKTVKMMLESGQGVDGTSVNASSTTIVGWQTLTFNFANATPTPNYSAVLNRAILDYDPSSTTRSSDFFFDDVSFNGATPAALTAPPLLVNFDSTATGIQNGSHYSADGNGWFEVLADSNQPWAPANGSVGSTNMAKAVMGSGGYSGVFAALDVSKRLVSSTTKVVTMNFWAPEAGKTVKLTLESDSQVNGTSVNASATTVVGWQTLTFDFANASPTPNYSAVLDRAIIDYDPTSAARSQDFFFDDVSFNGAAAAALTNPQAQSQQSATVSLVTTFSQTVQYTFETLPANWMTFEGATAGLTATPAGINAPSGTNSGYITESPGVTLQTYAGLVIDSRTSTEVISNTSMVVQLRVKAPTSTTSVTLKLEQPGNDPGGSTPTLYVQKSVTAGTTSWQVLTFDFSSGASGTYTEGSNYSKITMFFNLGLIDPANQTFYFDDLAFTPSAVTAAVTPRTGENKGLYPHIRLDKGFMDTYLDATWWDGVWQYRDEDTRAYLKYIPVRSTFKLTYTVTDANNEPMADALVTLIVNANYSCAKTFFMYENSIIGPDDCAGNGETQLPAKRTDSDGKVTFVLTNTNTEGEKMPSNLNGAPNGKEIGTNIKPHLVGAKQEGIDMLFAHFVEQSDAAKVVASATATAKTGEPYSANFEFLDETGKPMANQLAEVFINGPESKQSWVLTDEKGRVSIPVPNANNLEGTSAVAVSVKRTGRLPLTATSMVNWVPGALKVSMAPSSNSVEVKVVNAANKSVKIVINGKSYDRTPTTGLVTYKFPATLGQKVIRVTIGKKTFVRSVTVKK